MSEFFNRTRIHECTRMMPTLSILVNGIGGESLYTFHNPRGHSLFLHLDNTNTF